MLDATLATPDSAAPAGLAHLTPTKTKYTTDSSIREPHPTQLVAHDRVHDIATSCFL
jgi:hypothetical protein